MIMTCFMSGKLLILAKVSLAGFIYDVIDVFFFPNKRVRSLFEEKGIIQCFVYLLLTITDSALIQFILVYDKLRLITNKEAQNFISEITSGSKIFGRLNLLLEYFEGFNVQDEKLRKLVGMYEIEAIDNRTMISIKVNPEEYYEHYKTKNSNNRPRGASKGTIGMTYMVFGDRILSLHEQDDTEKN